MNRALLLVAAASLLFAGPALSQSQQNQAPAKQQADKPSPAQNKAASTGQGQETKSAKSSKKHAMNSKRKGNHMAAKGHKRTAAKGNGHRKVAKKGSSHRMAQQNVRAATPQTTGSGGQQGWNWGTQQPSRKQSQQQSFGWQQPQTGPCKNNRRPDGSWCYQ